MKTITTLLAASFVLTAASPAAVVFIDRLIFDYEACGPGMGGNTCQFLDMDGDGTRDFYFAEASDGAFLVPLGDNRVLSVPAILPDLGRYTVAMTGGELIGAAPTSGFWMGRLDFVNEFDVGSVIYACFGRGGVGQPPVCISTIPGDLTTRYMGVEFISGGTLHYGWIGVYAVGLGTRHDVVINGWAYESEAGQALAAGQVPEPSSVLLLFCSRAFTLRRRRSEHKDTAKDSP